MNSIKIALAQASQGDQGQRQRVQGIISNFLPLVHSLQGERAPE